MESFTFLSLPSIEEENKLNSRLKFKEQAERWSKVKIHKSNNEYIYIYIYIYIYTLVHSKLNGAEELFGKSHGSC